MLKIVEYLYFISQVWYYSGGITRSTFLKHDNFTVKVIFYLLCNDR